jgi:predicted nucleic acid-binding protein
MKYVLDASVGLKTVLPETGSDKAEALVGEFQQQIHELIAPDTYLVECAHALTRAYRKGLIGSTDAEAKFTLISNTGPDLFPHIPLLARHSNFRRRPASESTIVCMSLLLNEKDVSL